MGNGCMHSFGHLHIVGPWIYLDIPANSAVAIGAAIYLVYEYAYDVAMHAAVASGVACWSIRPLMILFTDTKSTCWGFYDFIPLITSGKQLRLLYPLSLYV